MSDEAPLKKTPLHAEHVQLGARMVPFAGYDMPVQYEGVKQEHLAARGAAALFDVSHMGELELDGAEAGRVIDELITNDLSKLAEGRALYTCALNESGTILDDLIVYRRQTDKWLVVCNASNREKIAAHIATAARDRCAFVDASDSTALIALQGPKAMAIAARLGDGGRALGELRSFALCDAMLGGVRCLVARTGYTGEDGVEIFCAAGDVVTLWRALFEVGSELGLKPAGLAARDTLRLEARLSLYGNDIDETTNPLEAGLAWTVKLDKPSFLGKQALLAIKAAGLSRKLVGFEMTGRGIARHGYPLLDASGATIGTCTSGSPGPTVNKNIGLGYVKLGHDAVGSKLLVDCRGKSIEAVVVPTPFYRRPS
ncbi:MAG: glycine cleavage system aminomethyltransferase GcvT [Myxococcales bacterium]|nr:glycine cleavage system aminomethyltransferase GcvT [Myxococcales bacterium]